MSRRADLVSNRRAGSFDTTNDHAQGCDLARWQTVDGHDNGQKRRGGTCQLNKDRGLTLRLKLTRPARSFWKPQGDAPKSSPPRQQWEAGQLSRESIGGRARMVSTQHRSRDEGRTYLLEGREMKINGDTTLIEAARQIAPVIRDHNDEAERERRLSKPVLAALAEAGLLQCLPRGHWAGWRWTRSRAPGSSERFRRRTAQLVGDLSTHCPGRLSVPDCPMRAQKSSSGGIRMP